ncbi:hypothetical protein O71_07439 [Pontibacter sp. BAB1700]|nr:hypothetical protein O71_07439 [Pontibacter sp. BAB1700]
MKLENKIAVVTGVSRGIGLAAVHALLEQGAKVAGWAELTQMCSMSILSL